MEQTIEVAGIPHPVQSGLHARAGVWHRIALRRNHNFNHILMVSFFEKSKRNLARCFLSTVSAFVILSLD